jgi:hypothetical protein
VTFVSDLPMSVPADTAEGLPLNLIGATLGYSAVAIGQGIYRQENARRSIVLDQNRQSRKRWQPSAIVTRSIDTAGT